MGGWAGGWARGWVVRAGPTQTSPHRGTPLAAGGDLSVPLLAMAEGPPGSDSGGTSTDTGATTLGRLMRAADAGGAAVAGMSTGHGLHHDTEARVPTVHAHTTGPWKLLRCFDLAHNFG